MTAHGTINWWGYSPPFDLLESTKEMKSEVTVLIVGAGDPRFLMKLLAVRKLHQMKTKVKVYIVESDATLYARILLLLKIVFDKIMGIDAKARLLLDIGSNLHIRSSSHQWLQNSAKELSRTMNEDSKLLNCIYLRRLKHTEKDQMVDYFDRCLNSDLFDAGDKWDHRLRYHLGSRYGHRDAESDWAWHMVLADRIEDEIKFRNQLGRDGYKSPGLNASWGTEFKHWRKSGTAFKVGNEKGEDLHPNMSLSSVTTSFKNGKRSTCLAFCGDMICGPVIPLSILSEDSKFCEKQNGRYAHNGLDVARNNIQYWLKGIEGANVDDLTFPATDGVEISFLSSSKFLSQDICKVNSSLDVVFISVALAHMILKLCPDEITEDTTLFVEDITLFPDIREPEKKIYEEKITKSCSKFGLQLEKRQFSPPFVLKYKLRSK